ncbi:hypothetical protein Tco_0329029 [Tanacetum coccineum]
MQGITFTTHIYSVQRITTRNTYSHAGAWSWDKTQGEANACYFLDRLGEASRVYWKATAILPSGSLHHHCYYNNDKFDMTQVEPSPPTPELVVEEPKEETMVDAPAPAEETPTTEVPAETETKVVDVPKSEIEEPKAEATPEEVQAVEEAKEETPVVEETPVTTKAVVEVEESVEEVEKPAEVIDATTEGAKEE